MQNRTHIAIAIVVQRVKLKSKSRITYGVMHMHTLVKLYHTTSVVQQEVKRRIEKTHDSLRMKKASMCCEKKTRE